MQGVAVSIATRPHTRGGKSSGKSTITTNSLVQHIRTLVTRSAGVRRGRVGHGYVLGKYSTIQLTVRMVGHAGKNANVFMVMRQPTFTSRGFKNVMEYPTQFVSP